MKKILTGILILAIVTVLYATTTETHYNKTIESQPSLVRKVVVASDANEITETLDEIYGYLERIVIDATGGDGEYKVYLKDENAITLFSKTDCDTNDGDYSYMISETGTDSNNFSNGIPVAGTCSVEYTDANALTSLSIIVYYRQEPQ